MSKLGLKKELSHMNSTLSVITPHPILSGNYFLEACILAMKSEKDEICFPDNTATYNIDSKTKLYYIIIEILPFIGVINNIFSMITIFQSKYNRRLLPHIMRILYISNLIVATVNSVYFLHRVHVSIASKTNFFTYSYWLYIKNFISHSLIKVSDVLITTMSVIKYIYSKHPFQLVYNENTNKYITLGTMFAIFVCFGMELDNLFVDPYLDRYNSSAIKSSFFIVCFCFIIIFNSLTLREGCLVKGRFTQAGEPITIILTRRLAHYTLMSSAIFIMTTLFPAVYLLLATTQHKVDEVTCDECFSQTQIDLLAFTMPSWNCYLDNLVYCILSSQYRHDLYSGLKKLLPQWKDGFGLNEEMYREFNSRVASRRETVLSDSEIVTSKDVP